MFCQHDGTENREGAKLCKKCGACLNCGQKDPGEKSCKNCRSPLSDSGPRQCPKGHSLPPGSDRCDICDTASAARSSQNAVPVAWAPRTEVEGDFFADGPPVEPRPTDAGRRKTIFAPPERGGMASPARKIVGVLITYSWKQEGEMFAIREGRNLIGRDPESDIAVPQDAAMTGKHAHITFRKNFVIGDMVSLGGTFVGGEPVEQQFQPLSNYATIQTGETVWTFVAIAAGQNKDKAEGGS